MTKYREKWLQDMIGELSVLFTDNGYIMPNNIRVTCGWCSRSNSRTSSQRIGECYSPTASGDNSIEIVISMSLQDPMKVAGVLAHELVHAVVGNENGHNKVFKKCAVAIGLEGKMTATTESEAFKQRVQPMIDKLGEYPHASLSLNNRKKQSTRMIKTSCPSCGYTARLSQKWIEVGTPICPVDNISLEVEQ